jgi:serine/threonine-protein kinase RsbW
VAASPIIAFRASFPSTFESVSDARRAVGAFACDCGFSDADVSDIVLAVGEACNNAAEHGHVESGCFTVVCVFDSGVFVIEIGDRGPGFGVNADRWALETPDSAMRRGRGIQIMRALMDRVEFRSDGTGTKAVMEKRLPDPARTRDRNPAQRLLRRGLFESRRELDRSDAGSTR